MWLQRELRAQLSRFGLALGVLSTAVVVLGACLPFVERRPNVAGPALSGESPVGLDTALIGYREGWFFVGLGITVLILLAVYRRYRFGRPLVAVAVLALGLCVSALCGRTASGSLLDPCNRGGPVYGGASLCGTLAHIGNAPPGYAFRVVDLGAGGIVLSALLLVVPAAAPRARRRRLAGREAVVWL